MLEKLKELGIVCRDLVLYLLVPVAFAVGFVWYLLSRNRELLDKLNQSKEEKELADVLQKRDEAKKQADAAVASFDELDREYRSRHPGPDL